MYTGLLAPQYPQQHTILAHSKSVLLTFSPLTRPVPQTCFHVWIINKLGLDNARPIPGLSSSNGYQAFLRGEIQLSSHGTANYLRQVKQGIDAGEITDLMTLGWIQPDGSIERVPYAPDTPTFAEQFETMTGAPFVG